jgi:hypothetical protein
MRRGLALLLAVGLAFTASAVRAGDTGSVEGRVAFMGKSLPEGTIAFHPEKGKPVEAEIDKNGVYKAKQVPVGRMRVTITTKKVRIPPKYSNPDTTGLVVEVLKGDQKVDIQLQ